MCGRVGGWEGADGVGLGLAFVGRSKLVEILGNVSERKVREG